MLLSSVALITFNRLMFYDLYASCLNISFIGQNKIEIYYQRLKLSDFQKQLLLTTIVYQ